MQDMKNNIKVVSGITPALAQKTDANGTTIDRLGFDSCTVAVYMGASGDTLSGSVYAEFKLEESDNGSVWSAVAEKHMIGALAGTTTGAFAKVDDPAEDDLVYKVGYVGAKRYVRAVVDVTGTHTNGFPLAIVGILGNPLFAPVA